MKEETIRLADQLDFALYVCSRQVQAKFRLLLEPYGLTYNGYLVLMTLWEADGLTIKEIGDRLFLDWGTLSPVVRKLEEANFVNKLRNMRDDRSVTVHLTTKGRNTEFSALPLPRELNRLISEGGIEIYDHKWLLKELHRLQAVMSVDAQ